MIRKCCLSVLLVCLPAFTSLAPRLLETKHLAPVQHSAPCKREKTVVPELLLLPFRGNRAVIAPAVRAHTSTLYLEVIPIAPLTCGH